MFEAASDFLVFFAVYFGFGYLVAGTLKNITPAIRIFASFTFSFWLCFLPTVVLSRLHALNFVTTFVLALTLLVVVSFYRWKKSAESTHIFYDHWLVAALCAVALFHIADMCHDESVRGGFFYLSEIKYIAESSGLPEQVTHFGEHTEPQVDKLGFTHLGALTFLLTGSEPLDFSRAGYLSSVILVALAAFAFFSCFLSAPLAACATIFTFCNLFSSNVLTTRTFYLPENVALIYLFSAAALFWQGINSQDSIRKLALCLSAAAAAACLLNHLEIGLLLLLLLSGLTVSKCLLTHTRYSCRHLAFVLGMLGCAVVFSYCLLGKAPDFIASSLTGEQYTAFQGNDPTYEFLAPQGKHTQFTKTPIPHPISDLVHQGLRLQGALYHSPLGTLAAISLVLTIAFLCLTRKQTIIANRRYTEPALAALISICAISLITIWSDRTFSIWVYQTEALRRIVPYCSLFVTWWLFLSFEYLATSASSGLFRFINFGTWCLTMILFTLSIPFTQPIHSPFRLSSDGFLALKQFENSPPAHILATEISTGAFHTLTSAHALLEGHQPVLRPTMIIKTLNLLEEARAFFRNPITNSNILDKYKITHVVVTMKSQGDFGGTRLLPAADVSKDLEKLAAICNPRSIGNIKVFEVCNQDLNAKVQMETLVD